MIQWQEIINVLNMREHVVFRNKRIPVGRAPRRQREAGWPASDRLCPKQELKMRGGCC